MQAHLDIKLWYISALWFKEDLMGLFVLEPHNLIHIDEKKSFQIWVANTF